MEEINIAAWSEFGEALQSIDPLRSEREKQNCGRPLNKPIFRGMGDGRWELETTLERFCKAEVADAQVSLVKYYRKIVASKAAVETMTEKRWENLPDYPAFQRLLNENAGAWLDSILRDNIAIYKYLIYLRHHGFPSPLLDWTGSPYITALFAFDSMDKDAEHVAIYAFSQDTLHNFSDQEHFFIVGPYIETHPRHYLQQSRYSLCVRRHVDGNGEGKRVDYLFKSHEQALNQVPNLNTDLMVELKIPADQRSRALEQLDLMNINPFSLFGSEESLVRTVRRECLFKNWEM